MSSINEELKKLYNSKVAGLKIIRKSTRQGDKNSRDLNGPLLMQCNEDELSKANRKILIIGQECGSDDDAFADVDFLIKRYGELVGRGSIFWQGAHTFNRFFNNDSGKKQQFFWTNVCKYSACGGGPLNNESDFEFTLGNFNVLEDEIAILKPDIILFLCGHNYDKKIELQFGEKKLIFSAIYGSVDEMAQIKFDDTGNSQIKYLPKDTYRTYHPRYLRSSNKWRFLYQIAAKIEGFDLEELLEELKDQLGSDYKVDDNFGEKNSGITYSCLNWKKYSIRFEFDGSSFGGLFYGINGKNEKSHEAADFKKIKKILTDSEELDDENWWPYWKKIEPLKQNADIFKQIDNGTFAKSIQCKVDDIIKKVGTLKL